MPACLPVCLSLSIRLSARLFIRLSSRTSVCLYGPLATDLRPCDYAIDLKTTATKREKKELNTKLPRHQQAIAIWVVDTPGKFIHPIVYVEDGAVCLLVYI